MKSLGGSNRVVQVEKREHLTLKLAISLEKFLERGSSLSLQLGVRLFLRFNYSHTLIQLIEALAIDS